MTLGALAPLAAYRQFVLVMLLPLSNGKTDKLPCDYRTGKPTVKDGLGAHNPEVWTDYETVRAIADRAPDLYAVGFVLTAADPFFCVDVDSCAVPGGWSEIACNICQNLPGCVIEVSQSGRGLHVWGRRSVLPPHSMKNIALHCELYSSKRFIVLGSQAVGTMADDCTHIDAVIAGYFPPREAAGTVADSGPREDWRGPTDDAELLRRALQSKSAGSTFGNKASFADLWHNDERALGRAFPPDSGSTEPYDRSSADAALAQHLAFWTGCDVLRIERLMRQSALVRDKWDGRSDYLVDRTIGNACRIQREVLQDKPSAVPDLTPVAAGIAAAREGMTAVEGRTFLDPIEQAKLFAGCVYVLDEHKVLVPGGKLLNPERFKVRFGGYSFSMGGDNSRVVRNAFEAFTESQALRPPIVDGTCFKPLLEPGAIVETEGRRRVNVWWPPEVRRLKGDPAPFLDHMAKLLPDPADRAVLLYYAANTVQLAGHKFQWAPLLQGVPGNGKTFLSHCIARALGERYVHWPAAHKLGAQFNSWMYGRLAYFVEDAFVGGDPAVLERLKPMITGQALEIERKGVDQVAAEVCGNFLFNANRRDAIRKTYDDRRYAVLWCAQQSVDDLARDGMDGDYFKRLYGWAEHDGYAIVADYLHTLAVPPEFGLSWVMGRAPRTSATSAAIDATRSPAEQAVLSAVEEGLPGFRGGWVSSIMLRRMLEGRRRLADVPLSEQPALLEGLGYLPHPALQSKGQVHNPVMPDSAKPRLYVLKGSDLMNLQRPADVARAYTAAQTAS